MNPDRTNQIRLTFTTIFDREPAWSPDGSKIAFVSSRDSNDEIYLMNSDGTNQTRLTFSTAYDREPAWSPDGSKIALSSWMEGNSDIFIMKSDGTERIRLTSNNVSDSEPAWSPDGLKIAFSSNRDDISNLSIYVMNSDGSNQTRTTFNPKYEYYPAWSPDGSKIAFVSAGEISIMNPDVLGKCVSLPIRHMMNNQTGVPVFPLLQVSGLHPYLDQPHYPFHSRIPPRILRPVGHGISAMRLTRSHGRW